MCQQLIEMAWSLCARPEMQTANYFSRGRWFSATSVQIWKTDFVTKPTGKVCKLSLMPGKLTANINLSTPEKLKKLATFAVDKVGSKKRPILPDGSFRKLFWQQQMKALSCQDLCQRHWHPLMIKWCLNLKLVLLWISFPEICTSSSLEKLLTDIDILHVCEGVTDSSLLAVVDEQVHRAFLNYVPTVDRNGMISLCTAWTLM